MEAQHLLRFFNEHHVTRSSGDVPRRTDSPLDYLAVTLRCPTCGRKEQFALRDCIGLAVKCSCSNAFESTGLEELITRVAAIDTASRTASPFPSARDNSPVARQFVILLVEDDAASELLTVRCIQRSDISCAIQVARDGRQAVDYLTDLNKPRPDLVLLDLSMPVMDGFDVLRSVRAEESLRFLPVVMLTTSSQPEAVEEAYDLGASGYVVKGSSLSKFRDDLTATLRYWLLASLRPAAGYSVRSDGQPRSA